MKTCQFPNCKGTRSKDSRYCLTHENVGARIILAMLNIGRPEPSEPPAHVWGGIDETIKQESES